MSEDIQTNNSRNLIAAIVNTAVLDALGVFRIPNSSLYVDSFQKQYDKLVKKDRELPVIRRSDLFTSRDNYNECLRARAFMERSYFDDLIGFMGYDSLFVNKTFALVQEAITLEKKLFEEITV